MPRQARLDFPGTLHHVIVRGIEQKNIVSDNQDRIAFVLRMGEVAGETGTIIYAWSLMPNHAHILLRSGNDGLSSFMRRFLTGYAITYNRRHRRYGHLFQNRYKSIVCDEETYFLELVRYIHLNSLRAGLVASLADLDKYRYSGHSVLMYRFRNDWQDRDYVLNKFGSTESTAKREYRKFIKAGVNEGQRPELVGGGLIRSAGGWSEVQSMRKKGVQEIADERILGSSTFVETVLEEAGERIKQQFSPIKLRKKVMSVIHRICSEEGIKMSELQGGSRRSGISMVRHQIARELVEEYGVSVADVARAVGVSASAISKALKRGAGRKSG